LVYLDRIDEAMTAAKTVMTKAEEALFFAKALRDESAPEEALIIARRGLTFSGSPPDYELALWTSQLAESLGDNDTALTARVKTFQGEPSFLHYQKIESLAGEDWPDLKLDLLDYLREFTSWRSTEVKVDIFLHENLVRDAIESVSHNYASNVLIFRVMDAAAAVDPDWVITNARRPAEKILTEKKADRYNEAINWLKKIRNAFYQSGRREEWQTYRESLIKEHSRKPKFMGLFKHQSLQ
jgi:uncharacterized Zn finger protein